MQSVAVEEAGAGVGEGVAVGAGADAPDFRGSRRPGQGVGGEREVSELGQGAENRGQGGKKVVVQQHHLSYARLV